MQAPVMHLYEYTGAIKDRGVLELRRHVDIDG